MYVRSKALPKGKAPPPPKKKGPQPKPVTLPQAGKLKQATMEAQLTAGPNNCEEASPLSQGKYIPCNLPAKHIVFMKADNKSYRMCEGCADHNVRRGGKITGPFVPAKEKQKPLMDDTKVSFPKKSGAKIATSLEEELGVETASKQELGNLSKGVSAAVKLMTDIENTEATLKGYKEELHKLTNQTIPDLMRSAKTKLHTTTAGVRIELKDFINGSLPKDGAARKVALTWLEKNGAKDLIKTEFELGLGRGQLADAKKLREAIKKLGLHYTEKEGIHPQSLYSFARERMKAGKELPIKTLGLYVGQAAKIEMPAKE